jgi:hypothetical protein
MPIFPILLGFLWLLSKPWPKWLQHRAIGQPVAFHRDGSVCRSRWCLERNETKHW